MIASEISTETNKFTKEIVHKLDANLKDLLNNNNPKECKINENDYSIFFYCLSSQILNIKDFEKMYHLENGLKSKEINNLLLHITANFFQPIIEEKELHFFNKHSFDEGLRSNCGTCKAFRDIVYSYFKNENYTTDYVKALIAFSKRLHFLQAEVDLFFDFGNKLIVEIYWMIISQFAKF
jgi:hypothetical protein